MKYRAYWKSTWYECEDYYALCCCLIWVGAEYFTCVPVTAPSLHLFESEDTTSVVIYKYED